MQDLIIAIQHSALYQVILVFFAFYPMVSSITWISTSLFFYFRWERKTPPGVFEPLQDASPVTILIPAFCEGRVIRRTLEGVLAIDYPNREVLVIDDASTDDTVDEVMPFVERGDVRLIRKRFNEGKAMALNDAMPCARGELVLIMDADAYPDPQILNYLVPHFESVRVAGVTGNPRVANRGSFLAKLQLIEFASIVGLLRRSQRIWGRLLTMSGVVGIFRRSALIDVGLYSPEMATEDIDITWKLQRHYYDVRYEPRALVWMQVPSTLRGLIRQRIRWAKGLGQVLRRHGDILLRWSDRRIWPVLIEATLSVIWAYCVVLLTLLWSLSYVFGYPPVGVSPFPNWWGMLIATMCLAQLMTGVLLDRRYDKSLTPYFGVAVFYPIIYWMLMALITFFATPSGMRSPKRENAPTRWRTARE